MDLLIQENQEGWLRYLVVTPEGIIFEEPLSEEEEPFEIPYEAIEGVLLSEDHYLSIQAYGVVFTLQTDPDIPQHQHAIETLIDRVEQTA